MPELRSVTVGIPLIPILFAIIAYFVYGSSLDAALAVLLLDFLWSFAMVVALIPFVGIFAYYYVMTWIFDWVNGLTGLTWTWLIDVMMWVNLIIGGIFWAVITGIVVMVLTGRFRKECRIDETGREVCRWVFR